MPCPNLLGLKGYVVVVVVCHAEKRTKTTRINKFKITNGWFLN